MKEVLAVVFFVFAVAGLVGFGLLLRYYIGQGRALTSGRHRVALLWWFMVVAVVGGVCVVLGLWVLRGELDRKVSLWIAIGAGINVIIALIVSAATAGERDDD